jgi:hypothetical protein
VQRLAVRAHGKRVPTSSAEYKAFGGGDEDHGRGVAAGSERSAAVSGLAGKKAAATIDAIAEKAPLHLFWGAELGAHDALPGADGEWTQGMAAHPARVGQAPRRAGRGIDRAGRAPGPGHAGRVDLHFVMRDETARAGSEVLAVARLETRDRRRIECPAVDREIGHPDAAVAGGLVEEVMPLELVHRGARGLNERSPPVVLLEVEAFGHGGRGARRLLGQELNDSQLGHVLMRLVEANAIRVGAGIAPGGTEASVLDRAVERVGAVPGRGRAQCAGRGREGRSSQRNQAG